MPQRRSGSGIVPGGGGGGLNVAQVPSFPNGSIVSTVDTRVVPGTSVYSVANHMKGVRVIIPKTGTLKGFSVWVTTASGNCEGAVIDTTVTTRNVLWSSGSVVVAGASVWQTIGDPNISVTIGQQLDLAFTIDNITASIARAASIASLHTLPAAFPVQASGGAANKMNWDAAQTIPIGSTIAEASLVGTSIVPLIIAYIV